MREFKFIEMKNFRIFNYKGGLKDKLWEFIISKFYRFECFELITFQFRLLY